MVETRASAVGEFLIEIGAVPLEMKICPVCGSDAKGYNISLDNLQFLHKCLHEKNIDDAISLARVAWSNFPKLRLSEESKTLINELLKKIQEQVSNTLSPIDMLIRNLNPLVVKLGELTEKLPKGIREEFSQTNKDLADKMKEIYDATTETPLQMAKDTLNPLSERMEKLIEKLPEDIKSEFTQTSSQLNENLKRFQETTFQNNRLIQERVTQLTNVIGELIRKPSAIGRAGEKILADQWQDRFTSDKVEKKGGPGESDVLVVPYLQLDGTYGQRIVAERKTGKTQKYCGGHVQKAISHAKAEGSKYLMLVYDDQTNLVESLRPFQLMIQDGIVIAIADLETGGWRVAREAFGVFQSITKDITEIEEKIDIKEIQITVEGMQTLNQQIERMRTQNNNAIKNCVKVRESITKLEISLDNFRQRLRTLLLSPSTQRKSAHSQTKFA